MNPQDVPAWLQAGGLLAFAAAVYWEQRAMRSTLERVLVRLEAIAVARELPRERPPSQPTAGNP